MKFRNAIYTLAVCGVGLLGSGLKAQNNQFKEVIPRTPNAGSLGKYGDIPVSHHTGVPNISIPIYTVQEGPLSLPISLSYHSSGIKVDEVASWVGLGWSLNAGGMISRTVMGGPDEGLTSFSGGYSDKQGWGWYRDYGLLDKLTDPFLCDDYGNPNQHVVTIPGQSYSCAAYFLDAANGLIDTEPDIFTFNVSGSAGKFLFDENRTVYTIPWEDVYIKPTNDLFAGWTVITPDGTKYTFGGANATEKNYTHNGATGGISAQYNTSTTWYLTKIESANGKHWISLTYETENYGIVNRVGHSVTVSEVTCTIPASQSLTQAPTHLIRSDVSGVRLSQISTSSGNVTVDFLEANSAREDLNAFQSGSVVNSQSRALSAIKIEGQTLCKEYSFNTAYFESPITGYSNALSDMKRLKLISVGETSCDGSVVVPPHQFFYNETVAIARRLSLAKDFWGYYNGAMSNAGLIPNGISSPCSSVTLNGGANRSTNITAMKGWILEKVQYPTSGSLILAYGAHKYNNGTKTAGGLRIETITRQYQTGPDVVTAYEYPVAFLYSKDPTNISAYWSDDPWLNYSISQFLTGRDFGYTITGTPPSPLYGTQGYHLGYETVKEVRSDASYNRYFYNSTVVPQSSAKFPAIAAQNPIGSAQLQNQGAYSANDQPSSYTLNTYGASPAEKTISAMKVVSLFDARANGITNFDDSYAAATPYQIKTYRHRLQAKTETTDGITIQTNYSYDPTNKHGNPVLTSVQTSDGSTQTVENIYPSDAGSGAPNAMFNPGNTYFKNMTGVVVDSKVKVDGTVVSQDRNYFTYNSSDQSIQLTSSRTYPSGGTDYIESHYSYDTDDNIAMVQKAKDIKTSYLWGYNGAYPVAQVVNADVKDVYLNTFENAQGNSTEGDAKTGKKSRTNGLFKTLTGLTNGEYILSYWKKTGSSWNLNSQTVNVTGTGYSISLSDQVDDVKFYPKEAQMTIYTYEPGLGITTATDVNNRITTYVYDKLGRLSFIKDDEQNILKTYSYNYQN